jgi:transposase InsO family protein
MDGVIDNHVIEYNGCPIVSRTDPPEPMVRTELPAESWEFLAIDFLLTHIAGSGATGRCRLFSRAIRVRAMKETDADQTCDQLGDLFATFGYAERMEEDSGPPFQSLKFKEWAQSRSIKLIFSTPAAPWMNGEVESQMRGIGKTLTIAVAQKFNWQVELSKYVFAYNRRVHSVTGQKPIDLLFK